MKFIELKNVNKVYSTGVTALADMSVTIQKGEFVFVIGHTASGKSTFIKMLYREEKPTKGSVVVGGVNVAKLRNGRVYKLRRKIGVVFQDFKLLPKLTVYENVAFALECLGMKASEIKPKVMKAIEIVGLKEKVRSFPHQLSGGEQQRVCIARAIVNEPKLLICDEPTGNLDPETSKEIMKVIDDINKELKTTVIMATHDKDIVNRMKKRVLLIEHGVLTGDYLKGSYKSHKAFRIVGRSIRDAFKSVFRNFSLSMASILCATITLMVVSISLIIAGNVENATNSLENELSIVVYLEKTATDDDINYIKSNIEKLKNVDEVTFKSKNEWKLEISEYSAEMGTVFSTYDVNPLLDSFTVTVKDVNDLENITTEIRKMDKIESANYGEDTVDTIISVFDVVKKATIFVVIALIFVTAFLITNTIKLTIYSRKNEIEIMRLVGASNVTIKLPFVIEGFIIGFLGSLIPIIVTIYGYIIAYNKLDGHIITDLIKLIEPYNFVFNISLLVAGLGALIGMFGSLRAVRKYLKI